MTEIRSGRSASEVESALAVLDAALGDERGWRTTRTERAQVWTANPGRLAIAVDDGRVVGAVGCDETGIGSVGVMASRRGRGIGRLLLEHAEGILRQQGVTQAGLGALDEAVEFYLSCGYQPQLLVQFSPDARNPHGIADDLLGTVLRGHEVVQSEYQSSPQLWLQSRTVDWELKRQIEAAAVGVVAQYVMSKQL